MPDFYDLLCIFFIYIVNKVNNILSQPGKFATTEASPPLSPKRKRSRRSLVLLERDAQPMSVAGKRQGPRPLKFCENDARDSIIADQEVPSRLWVISRKMSVPQTIPSWTGFNVSVSSNITVVTTSIGYLDCIDASASGISTINQVLHRCLKIKDSLKITFNCLHF